ncbi:hypothetical protein amb0474 [Paramagnetospirillum magneticum AMB-1]|uniref:DUF2460 domain-containing protein n=2 Tax=Paramagnetospirillum magneticum TaxID=84159 RepID=Q2WA47_PARM1|nr:hypothetical protein amb0474 [Paramagnetospirillum magneticum AMB-1]
MAAVPLHLYQRDWFLDRSRFKIGMFARQTGKTFTTTLEIVDDCFEAWAQGQRARWVILSRGERQAKEAMDAGIKLHAQAYQMGIESEVTYDWRPEDNPDVSYTPGKLTFAAAPAAGAAIEADFSYYFPCFFEEDTLDFAKFMHACYRADKVAFLSEK